MILLLFSLLGLFLFARWAGKRCLHPAFLPAVTVSAISCLVCLGGMLGGIESTERILMGIGLVSFAGFGFREIWHVAHGTADDDWRELGWVIGCFVILYIGSALWTRNQFLYSYDDFSHWGLVAKILATERRLPVEADRITFPSYPLGSAAFIDYCSSVLGGEGNHFLFAQTIMTFSFLLSLQSCSGKKPIGYSLTTLLAVALICYHNSINTLSVDNLLGAAFLAALIIFLHDQEHQKKEIPFLMIVLAGMVMIKNSGFLLAIMIMGFQLLRLIRRQAHISLTWLWATLPLLMYAAWHVHIQSAFISYGKHYMSLYLYYANMRGNAASLGHILRIILPRMLSPMTDFALWLIPAFFLLYTVSTKEARPSCRRVICMAAVIFLLYEAGMLLMYVCSMDAGEVLAHQGNDYARYNSTITLGLLGIAVYLFGQICFSWGEKKSGRQIGLVLGVSIFLCGVLVEGISFPRTTEENRAIYTDPYVFSQIAEKLRPMQTDRVIILSREPNDDGYIYYLAEYYLPGSRYRVYQDRTAAEQDHQSHPENLLINLQDGTWEDPK